MTPPTRTTDAEGAIPDDVVRAAREAYDAGAVQVVGDLERWSQIGVIARALQARDEGAAKIAEAHTCGACGMDGKIAAAIRAGA